MLENFPHRFIEETMLTVFLWIGLWGSISQLLDHLFTTWIARFSVYIVLAVFSFLLLYLREHIVSPK
jgi:hypothetical protein